MSEQLKPTGQRAYTMRRRRQQLDATRQRITEAAFDLHSTVGPAQTSISAVAERAGVQRHTVYHHFPDLTSLFRACTEHGMRTTGIPDAAAWAAIEDPTARLRSALGDLYLYYRTNARLLGNIIRDMPQMTDVGGSEAYVERMTKLFSVLASGWTDGARAQRLRMAVIGHAMSYETWRSLTDRGLADAEATELMLRLVAAAVGVEKENQALPGARQDDQAVSSEAIEAMAPHEGQAKVAD
jgi:AcrR family transcriptional regulator